MQASKDESSRRRHDPARIAGGVVALTFVALSSVLTTGCVETRRALSGALSGAPAAPLHERMSEDDVVLADATVQRALEKALSEDTRTWRNAGNGNEGSVTPERTWRTAAGVFCRAYRETLTIGARTELYRDVACRDNDGVWRPAR